MKKLIEFMAFDLDAFLKEKDIRVLASEPWIDYSQGSDGKTIGTKYKCIIFSDNTKYKNPKDAGVNAVESLTIKVSAENKHFKKLSKVKIIEAEAKVYGDYSNMLSVKAKDIEFIEK
ncbi:MAG: hypothetical protein E6235_02780 [Anaerococcus vaginalis]|uniref:hypothetical protein n=1 Tax=Anaerococcus TaxID=165779 RepID=UPI0008A3FFC2|nr:MULTISPECIES: hypothetical protein [Anaerococcus]MDU5085955.1 hypothetical protein [Anaerococcus vaginalis]OFL13937.1 hypothetical protein HMPREF2782_03855 [Anaerococcus sp. HMSC068A02]